MSHAEGGDLRVPQSIPCENLTHTTQTSLSVANIVHRSTEEITPSASVSTLELPKEKRVKSFGGLAWSFDLHEIRLELFPMQSSLSHLNHLILTWYFESCYLNRMKPSGKIVSCIYSDVKKAKNRDGSTFIYS